MKISEIRFRAWDSEMSKMTDNVHQAYWFGETICGAPEYEHLTFMQFTRCVDYDSHYQGNFC